MSGPGDGTTNADFLGVPQARGWILAERRKKIVSWLVSNRKKWDRRDADIWKLAAEMRELGFWSPRTIVHDIRHSLRSGYLPKARAALGIE